jgi:hypothetical protein
LRINPCPSALRAPQWCPCKRRPLLCLPHARLRSDPALSKCPANGAENDDHNPPRIASRNLFDMSVGHDNLFHGDKHKWSAQLTVINLTNKYALYNFLSTFSGTHYSSRTNRPRLTGSFLSSPFSHARKHPTRSSSPNFKSRPFSAGKLFCISLRLSTLIVRGIPDHFP